MASIYDKALKRKDFSGITNKDNEDKVTNKDSKRRFYSETMLSFYQTLVDKTKAQKKEEKDKAAKADDAKAGADVGKIVNLMAGDANRVCGISLFFLIAFLSPHILDRTNNIFALFHLRRYTQSNFLDSLTFVFTPFFSSFRTTHRWCIPISVSQNVIPICSRFSFDLCRLLGLSAFAGFIVLLAGWPLNSFIARRSIRIQKGVLAARDKRMGVLNELIGAVCAVFVLASLYSCVSYQIKFIKFFAWEERWITRAMDSREAEMKWMVKGKLTLLIER